MENAPLFRDRTGVRLGGERADLLFEAMAHPYRRFTLWYLWEADGSTSMEQLAREIDAWQSTSAESNRGVTGAATIELALRHTHLPKLETADLVGVDDDTVALLEGATDALVHLAELVEE